MITRANTALKSCTPTNLIPCNKLGGGGEAPSRQKQGNSSHPQESHNSMKVRPNLYGHARGEPPAPRPREDHPPRPAPPRAPFRKPL